MLRPLALLLSTAVLFSAGAVRADEFDAVTCGADIPQALIGKKPSMTSTDAIEARHKALGLKSLGGDGDDSVPYSMAWWEICHGNLVLLIDHRTRHLVISDALVLPEALRDARQSLPGSSCERQGKPAEDDLFALLDKETYDGRAAVKQAWRIDRKTIKFVRVPVDDLTCRVE